MVFAVIHLLATALLLLPTMFIWRGLVAIGARSGWWVGEPTDNDGEELFAIPVGLLGWGVVMVLTAGLVTWLFRPWKAGRTVVAGWLLLLVVSMLIVLITWLAG